MSEFDVLLTESIEALAEKAAIATEAGHALHFSQAALNLAQAKATIDNINDNRKQKNG